jgi:hypothetical protein
MADPLNIDPVRQQYDWHSERQKFRKANQERVRHLLHPVMVPYRQVTFAIWALCDHGKMILRNEWKLTLFQKSERFLSDLDRHAMNDNPWEMLDDIPEAERLRLAEQLSYQARNAVLLDSVTIPGGEDYDGPPIYDLENEEEILAVTEAMTKFNQSEKEKT